MFLGLSIATGFVGGFLCRRVLLLFLLRFAIFFFASYNQFFLSIWPSILKVKSYWKIKVKLYCPALMTSIKSIEELDINFRTVECTIFGFNRPRSTKFLQSNFQRAFSLVPNFLLAKVIVRTSR